MTTVSKPKSSPPNAAVMELRRRMEDFSDPFTDGTLTNSEGAGKMIMIVCDCCGREIPWTPHTALHGLVECVQLISKCL